MKILVIKRDKIGDLLLTTPMLAHLKRALPHAEVHLLANDYNAWVVAEDPHIDRRWIYPRVRIGKRIRPAAALSSLAQMMALRAQGFDWAIVANGSESPRAIERARWCGARRTVAYVGGDRVFGGLTDPLPESPGRHEADRLLDMLRPLGIAPPLQPPLPEYRLPQGPRDFAMQWLREHGLAPQGYAVIGLGARRAKKQPTVEQVHRWSNRLKQDHGLDTVFMWTPGRSDNPLYPGDDDVAERVLVNKPAQLHPFRGALHPALGLIWSARVSIFPDSGLMHFAAASPGGVLGLFAETDVSPSPHQWGPRGARADYLEAAQSVSELTDAVVFERLGCLMGPVSVSGAARGGDPL